MSKPKKNNLSSWLLWQPLRFACISLGLMLGAALIYGLFANLFADGAISGTLLGAIMAIMIAISTWLMLRRLSGEKLERRSFIALNTAQMFIISIAFMITTIVIVTNLDRLMAGSWLLIMHSHFAATLVAIILGIIYLYLIGLFFANTYAKYLRARAMGVPMRKALCSIPFGLSLLWIPGYVLPEKATRKQAVPMTSKWYSSLVDNLMNNSLNCVAMLIALIVISGFFIGLNFTIITIVLGIVFAIWARITGVKKFLADFGGTYATFSVLVNIAIFAVFIIMSTFLLA